MAGAVQEIKILWTSHPGYLVFWVNSYRVWIHGAGNCKETVVATNDLPMVTYERTI